MNELASLLSYNGERGLFPRLRGISVLAKNGNNDRIKAFTLGALKRD
ncbi:hypothetical protein SAMN04487969_11459 [Paenibacillus algorifonticola]|uniref:Uncharacterized protein n=1 Tax=Paenibacillus algorifonticola TaxID=684063 RepID=A0A1I2G322_9BACL|nr:hypothetical protein SAMN04487969_11459 [Paenibacillus algorifonticola]